MTDEELIETLESHSDDVAREAARRLRELSGMVHVQLMGGSEDFERATHVRRGTTYRVFPEQVHVQVSGEPLRDGDMATLYMSESELRLSVRRTAEFRDGRFRTPKDV